MKKIVTFIFCFLFFSLAISAQQTNSDNIYKGATVRQAFPNEIVADTNPILLKEKNIEVVKPDSSQIIQHTPSALLKINKPEVRQANPSEIMHTTDPKLLKSNTITILNSPAPK